jgi:hypothetical protein
MSDLERLEGIDDSNLAFPRNVGFNRLSRYWDRLGDQRKPKFYRKVKNDTKITCTR